MTDPASHPYPTQLSDLCLPTTPTIYSTLKALKKTTLSLHNRLLSILTDAAYITTTIHTTHFPGYALIANERCGSWYIPPHLKSGSAYFKSTDGHYGAWDLSLRRLNLQVLEVLGREGRAVLVDSTRRGKRMPDALRRTVPMWVLVWNVVLFGEWEGREEREWAFRLQHPGLEAGEVRLIGKRVDGWVKGLKGLGLDLEALRTKVKRPVRLVWVVHGEDVPDVAEFEDEESNVLVLCSASRRVLGAEMSEDGYIQGAADDAEGWSGGLTSKVFWRHKDELISAPEADLPDLLSRLVAEEKDAVCEIDAMQITPTNNIFVAAVQPGLVSSEVTEFDLMIDCNGRADIESPKRLNLGCRSGKLGSKDLRERLMLAINRASTLLNKDTGSKVLIVCEDGKDLSIGVAVTILCLLYNDAGQLVLSRTATVDKQLVKKRLAWITSIKSDANPSRSTLQAVNSVLMQPPS